MAVTASAQSPFVIAHRGASGERPEHTLASYERAIEVGADFIEPDLVATSDGVLVARHENEISGTTDVADHPEFADRKATKTIDGTEVTGWFTEDFTFAELRTLRAKERIPEIRPANTAFDGQFQIPTFAEIVALAKAKEAETGRRIGIYPEIKHPTHFRSIGIDLEALLLKALDEAGYRSKDDPIFVQCFEVGPLQRMALKTDLKMVLLAEAGGGPADMPGITYAELLTPEGLKQVATYADAVGADIRLILNPDGTPTALVANAKSAGLDVHAWTLRRENSFLPPMLQNGTDPTARGKYEVLLALLKAAGVAGIFTDNPADMVAAR